MKLETLADVQALIEKHLPAEYRANFTLGQLAGLFRRVAGGQHCKPYCRDPAAFVRGDNHSPLLN